MDSEAASTAPTASRPAGSTKAPAAAPAPVLSHHELTIQPGHVVLLRLPSGTIKPVDLAPGTRVCSLGKFGQFDPQLLVGEPYGRSYEIRDDRTLRLLGAEDLLQLDGGDADADADAEADGVGAEANGEGEAASAQALEAAADAVLKDMASTTNGASKRKVGSASGSGGGGGGGEREQNNNEFIFHDDADSNQLLSTEEIRALRESGSDRETVVAMLKRNNRNFALKNDYSKAKYTARKMAKYAKRMTTLPPTAFDVLELLNTRNKHVGMTKIPLTQEALAMMLAVGDVRPGGRYLVVDELGGLLVAAILERGGDVVIAHDAEHYNIDNLKFFPHLDEAALLKSGRLQSINWLQIVEIDLCLRELDDTIVTDERHQDGSHLPPHAMSKSAVRRLKEKVSRRRQQRRLYASFRDTQYDGVLVGSETTPSSIVGLLLHKLGLSRKFVIYSPFREPLLGLRRCMALADGLRGDRAVGIDESGRVIEDAYLDTDAEAAPASSKQGSAQLVGLLAQTIAEVREREIQVLPGRSRPVMTSEGEWGFVWHAIKIAKLYSGSGDQDADLDTDAGGGGDEVDGDGQRKKAEAPIARGVKRTRHGKARQAARDGAPAASGLAVSSGVDDSTLAGDDGTKEGALAADGTAQQHVVQADIGDAAADIEASAVVSDAARTDDNAPMEAAAHDAGTSEPEVPARDIDTAASSTQESATDQPPRKKPRV